MLSLKKFVKEYCRMGHTKSYAIKKYNKAQRLHFGEHKNEYEVNETVEIRNRDYNFEVYQKTGVIQQKNNDGTYNIILRDSNEILENIGIEDIRLPTADVSKYYFSFSGEKINTIYVLYNKDDFNNLLKHLEEALSKMLNLNFEILNEIRIIFVTEIFLDQYTFKPLEPLTTQKRIKEKFESVITNYSIGEGVLKLNENLDIQNKITLPDEIFSTLRMLVSVYFNNYVHSKNGGDYIVEITFNTDFYFPDSNNNKKNIIKYDQPYEFAGFVYHKKYCFKSTSKFNNFVNPLISNRIAQNTTGFNITNGIIDEEKLRYIIKSDNNLLRSSGNIRETLEDKANTYDSYDTSSETIQKLEANPIGNNLLNSISGTLPYEIKENMHYRIPNFFNKEIQFYMTEGWI